MEVILLERVPHVGDLGAKVSVKPGFGRNFLVPTGKALSATPKNLAFFEARRAELELAEQKRLQSSRDRALVLEGLSLTIPALAGEEGKLFGSVGAHEIVDAVKALGHELAKSEVRLLEGPIRQLGSYEVALHLLGDEVTSKIQVLVVAAKA